ncbi:MAG: 16S rRNA (guanine(527)-N(7))-methyltransferase RsmG [Fibrobacter sp.]|nr:16S rRNA (guanine(527)-N(7))-methyltransferase RsmG [Fibrobacter sp.]
MTSKEFFKQYLKENFSQESLEVIGQFESYFDWLVSENQKINLMSRKTDPEEIWSRHFADSLLATKFVNFSQSVILDFGTGGGFPGVPLAILYPDSKVFLLDSRKKKINALRDAVKVLGLKNCDFFDTRIEEVPPKYNGFFDIIVSRSVKIIPSYKKILFRLLKPSGKLVLYKSKILDDAELFEKPEIHDTSSELIGERKIVVVNAKDFGA